MDDFGVRFVETGAMKAPGHDKGSKLLERRRLHLEIPVYLDLRSKLADDLVMEGARLQIESDHILPDARPADNINNRDGFQVLKAFTRPLA